MVSLNSQVEKWHLANPFINANIRVHIIEEVTIIVSPGFCNWKCWSNSVKHSDTTIFRIKKKHICTFKSQSSFIKTILFAERNTSEPSIFKDTQPEQRASKKATISSGWIPACAVPGQWNRRWLRHGHRPKAVSTVTRPLGGPYEVFVDVPQFIGFQYVWITLREEYCNSHMGNP